MNQRDLDPGLPSCPQRYLDDEMISQYDEDGPPLTLAGLMGVLSESFDVNIGSRKWIYWGVDAPDTSKMLVVVWELR